MPIAFFHIINRIQRNHELPHQGQNLPSSFQTSQPRRCCPGLLEVSFSPALLFCRMGSPLSASQNSSPISISLEKGDLSPSSQESSPRWILTKIKVSILTGISADDYLQYISAIKSQCSQPKARLSFRLLGGKANQLRAESFTEFMMDLERAWAWLTGNKYTTPNDSQQLKQLFFGERQAIDFEVFLKRVYPSPEFKYLHQTVSKGIHGMFSSRKSKKPSAADSANQAKEQMINGIKSKVGQWLKKFQRQQRRQMLPKVQPIQPLKSLTIEFVTQKQKSLSTRISSNSSTELARQPRKELLDEAKEIMQFLPSFLEQLNQQKSMPKSTAQLTMGSSIRQNVHSQKIGKSVYLGHSSWKLATQMMLGIRTAVRSSVFASSQPDHGLSYSYELMPIKVMGTQDTKANFTDYAPSTFRLLREKWGISDSKYLRSVGPESLLPGLLTGQFGSLSELSSQGKSGSFFYYSADGKYMLKTISRAEFDSLLNILPDYYQHILAYEDSIITRFFGLHSLTIEKGYSSEQSVFVVMGNFFNPTLPIIERFDLKGSWYDRYCEIKDSKTCRKDNNFVKERPQGIILPTSQRNALIKIIKEDAAFFSKHGLIDYSLLLGVSSPERIRSSSRLKLIQNGLEWYQVGIIDFLTVYGARKACEYHFKSTLFGEGVSAAPPIVYHQRFVHFIEHRVFPVSKQSNDRQVMHS